MEGRAGGRVQGEEREEQQRVREGGERQEEKKEEGSSNDDLAAGEEKKVQLKREVQEVQTQLHKGIVVALCCADVPQLLPSLKKTIAVCRGKGRDRTCLDRAACFFTALH